MPTEAHTVYNQNQLSSCFGAVLWPFGVNFLHFWKYTEKKKNRNRNKNKIELIEKKLFLNSPVWHQLKGTFLGLPWGMASLSLRVFYARVIPVDWHLSLYCWQPFSVLGGWTGLPLEKDKLVAKDRSVHSLAKLQLGNAAQGGKDAMIWGQKGAEELCKTIEFIVL